MRKAKTTKTVVAPAPVPTCAAPPSPQPKLSSGKRLIFGSLAIFLLVFAIYFPALHGEFLWDDLPVFIEHPIITSPNGLEIIWIKTVWLTTDFPLTLTTFWLEQRLWGRNPTGYHVTNFALHALAAILLWRVLLRLNIRGAFCAAMIFAAHPVCVASVAWISERKNTLSLPFFLLSLLFYLRSHEAENNSQTVNRPSPIFYIGSLAAFFLGLLSKTSIVGLPVVLLGIAWWQNGKITRRDILKSIPFFLLSIGFGLLTIYAQTSNAIRGEVVQTETFAARLAESAWAIWFYLWKILVPCNLSAIYPHWTLSKVTLLSLVPLVALAGIAYLGWLKRNVWGRHSLLALGFFVTMLFPVLGFIDMYFLIFSRVADQWQYVPLIGVIVFVSAGGAYWLERKVTASRNSKIGLSAMVILILSALTWNHAKVYASEENLWSDTIKKNPKAWMAYNNLGRIYYQQNRNDEATRLFTESLRLKPDHAETRNNFGLALTRERKFDEAVAQFSEAIRLKRAQPKFHFNLGIALAQQGKLEMAAASYREALKLQPNYAVVHNNLSSTLNKLGRHRESLEHSQRALRLKTDFPEAHFNAGNAFVGLGDLRGAAEHFSAALKLRPDFHEARFDWGIALAMRGKFDEAAELFREVIRQNPDDVHAHTFLGNALSGSKKFNEAIAHYEIALRLLPDDSQIHHNLANTLIAQGNAEKAKWHNAQSEKLKPNTMENQRAGK